MTRVRAIDMRPLLAMGALLLAAALVPPAHAQDAVINTARTAGQIGEQADGFLGAVPGATLTAETRAHLDQINIRRRAAYASRATERNVSINEMAAAVACEVFRARIAVGEHYRDEQGQWRQRTEAAPVAVPSFCPP